jgi:two-component system, OmpR family, sensor histidine kinase BaeS
VSERAAPSRLSVLVHELRSPVAALVAIRDAAEAERDESASIAELVRLALAASAAIERVVGDAALTTIEPQRVDVSSILQDAAAAVGLQEGRVRVRDAPALPEVVVDPVRIRQALDNLVANALAQGDGEVVLEGRAEGDAVVLSVTDAGPGIPPADHQRIFEPGVRLGPAYRGSGLGLAIVKAIAEAHGGQVTVRSAPGQGATLSLVLPRTH